MRLFKRPHCVKQTTYCIALTLLFSNHHKERDFLRIISYAPVYSCTPVSRPVFKPVTNCIFCVRNANSTLWRIIL